ncbi:MAG: hypothetical protein IAF58_15215 [Leptolyngbya sp.]|nr:hypothetical protein [Candidatus Melainabacteria bacterium]
MKSLPRDFFQNGRLAPLLVPPVSVGTIYEVVVVSIAGGNVVAGFDARK